jgi:DNA-binding PadR family transcriptional regulator
MASATSNDPGLLVLVSLASAPRHGHAILLDIANFAGVRLGPGTLYGAISRLESDGLIEAIAPEGRRRPYRITDGGRSLLRRRLDGLERTVRAGRRRVAVPS